jgi:hypothetical protein
MSKMIDHHDEDEIRAQTLALEERIICAMKTRKMAPMPYRNHVSPMLKVMAMRFRGGVRG